MYVCICIALSIYVHFAKNVEIELENNHVIISRSRDSTYHLMLNKRHEIYAQLRR